MSLPSYCSRVKGLATRRARDVLRSPLMSRRVVDGFVRTRKSLQGSCVFDVASRVLLTRGLCRVDVSSPVTKCYERLSALVIAMDSE